MKRIIKLGVLIGLFLSVKNNLNAQSWTSDNGNGTYTNPMLNEDFSDPDIIRVGTDYYMVGSTMHTMPGLPVLHSKDLVNWKLASYAFDRIDMGPEFHLEGKTGAYGNGIWAPAIRYNKGTFYIFVNVNGYGLQVYTAKDAKGPWTHKNMSGKIYDLGVLFDDDGKIYAVHGYDEVHMIELKPDLSGYVEGSDKIIIEKGNAMGEGHHFYKINGKYYIISANYAPTGRMQCARADRPEGPYETLVISGRETMGSQQGWSTSNYGFWSDIPAPGDKIEIKAPGENSFAAVPIHQGGVVDLPNGDWWGFSMMDNRSAGRMTCLSPVTWKDGWPYFGLEGNLGRSPKTWIKPNTGVNENPSPAFKRSDDFSGTKLQEIWQWNHIPVDNKWSLKNGVLKLNTLPAAHFLKAKNTLTQRVAGPESSASVFVDGSGLKTGDIAGLGFLAVPYYWIAIERKDKNFVLHFYNELTNENIEQPLTSGKIYLKAAGNYDTDTAWLSYSTDGKNFTGIGGDLRLTYQLKTFQGVRYALFAYNTKEKEGGCAIFDDFKVDEPLADKSKNIPVGKIISFKNLSNNQKAFASPHGMLHFTWSGSPDDNSNGCRFKIHDRGQGRVALEALNGMGFVTVVGEGLSCDVRLMKKETKESLFQWQDMLRGQFMLMSLKTNRYVGLDPETGESYSADWPGTHPDRKDGTVMYWEEVKE